MDTQKQIPKSTIRTRLIDMGMSVIATDLFLEYHKQRPDIWRGFEKAALRLLETRQGDFGAKEICEYLRRGDDSIEGKGDDFKVNNNFTSLYARVFVIFHPEYENRIELRKATGPQRLAA